MSELTTEALETEIERLSKANAVLVQALEDVVDMTGDRAARFIARQALAAYREALK